MSSFFTTSTEEGLTSSHGSEAGVEGESHEEEHSDFGIGTLVLAMVFGMISRMYITHTTGLPYTVILLVIGLAFGVMLHEEVATELGVFWESMERWAVVSPDVILFVFLPVLIFESAFNTDVHIFQREFWQVVALAVPGVVLATVLTASVAKYMFPYEWGWDACLMLGGMLSATDPVAVVALLKELGVSERLAVLIEGESLLNDATAIVVFIVFRDALVGVEDSSPLSVLETAARMSLGGPVVGVVLGMLGSFSLGYIIDDALTEITLTVIVCFSAFMISEATKLHVSGVLAVVTLGLVMSFYARGRISPGVEETMHTFWSMATYVANTVIFFISGLIIGDRALLDHHIEGREWGLLLMLYVVLQIIRFFVVLVLLPVLTRGGYGMSHKQLAVLVFAGLRGAVVLTLGLIVVEDDRIDENMRAQVLFYVAGIAAMTLVINGTLTGSLVHYLGLDRSTTAETEIFVRACSAIEARLEHKLDLLKGDRFLGDADWELVWRYIPVSTAKSYWHRIRHGNINLSEEEEEEIHVNNRFHGRRAGRGFREQIQLRSRQVRKWFTRRVLRLHGGANYQEIPHRLRQTWYSYHKNFHSRNEPSATAYPHLEFDRHRRDMELHRLNAEPRMMLEAEAWSNLNPGGADVISDNQATASSTLRNHLDNVGINGLADAVGMMSDLGQAEMAQQAAGAASGSLLGRAGSGPIDGPSAPTIASMSGNAASATPAIDSFGAPTNWRTHAAGGTVASSSAATASGAGFGVGKGLGSMVVAAPPGAGGTGGDVVGLGTNSSVTIAGGGMLMRGSAAEEAQKAIEGIKKLKEDRRRAAQAVARAETRLARLEKDMGLRKHKGEEEEMAESILLAKNAPTAVGMVMPRGSRDDSGSVPLQPQQNPYFAPAVAPVLSVTNTSSHRRNSNNNSRLASPADSGYSFAYLDHDEQEGSDEEQKENNNITITTTTNGLLSATTTAPGAPGQNLTLTAQHRRNPSSGGGGPSDAPYSAHSSQQPSPSANAAARNRHFFGASGVAGSLSVGALPSSAAVADGGNSEEDARTALRIAELAKGHRRGLSGSSTGSGWRVGSGLDNSAGSGLRTGGWGSAEKAAERRPSFNLNGSFSGGAGMGALAAAVAAAGREGRSVKQHEVPASNAEGVAPEWDPYGNDRDNRDSDDDKLEKSGRGTAMGGAGRRGRSSDASDRLHRRDRGPSSVMGPGAVTMGSMSEARVRFLTAVKAHCTERYRQGWLSSTGLRVLKENMDAQLDHEEKELEQWSHLQKAFTLPAMSMANIRKIPIIGRLLEPYMYRRLTFIFELASNFISAHEDVDILELLNEGPVAYQLALEKNRQLKDARETLSKQLPVFPELARSLKTQVAARYMLVQHREVVHELFHHGHINEREFEGLIGQNNSARVRLDYHPHADQIPDRVTLLKNVPFLRFLTDEEKEAVINDEKACKEEFYGSNVILMKEKMSTAKGNKRAGWFNVVRGAVRQTTEGLLDHRSLGGTVRTRRLAKERLVNAGTVIGMDEQLLQAPYQCTYVTASFVHVFFFDKAQMIRLAEQYPGLKRGLWWLLAVSVVRHHRGFRRMNLMGVYQLMRTAEFRELRRSAATGALLSSTTHAGRRRSSKVTSAASPPLRMGSGPLGRNFSGSGPLGRNSTGSGPIRRVGPRPRSRSPLRSGITMSERRARDDSDINVGNRSQASTIRAAASAAASTLNESRHRLSRGLRRTVSRGSLSTEGGLRDDNLGERRPPGVIKHRLVLEPGSQVLLLRGMMFSRDRSHPLGGVAMRSAVTIIRDVSGPVDFSDGAVLFIMPAVLIQRSTSNHQLLMGEIQANHAAKEALASEEANMAAAAAAVSGEMPAVTPLLSKGKIHNLSASGGLVAQPQPTSPSRLNLGPPAGALISMRDTGELQHVGELSMRNAVATDAGTIAALDEANPMAHPDILRRKRTLRDAGLAAKAAPAAWSTSGDGGGSAGDGLSGSGGRAVRSRQNSAGSTSGEGAGGGGQATVSTRLALHSSSNRHGDMFVEMMDMPVAHMDEDSPRSSRAPSALLYPDSYVIDPAVHAEQLAQRLEEDRMQRQKDDMLQPAWGGEGGPNQESLPSPAAAASVSERPGAGVVGDEGRNV